MLFSEPKIPQWIRRVEKNTGNAGFSALQRAENSSIAPQSSNTVSSVCFSALQRAENSSMSALSVTLVITPNRFSALQRAENSSIVWIAHPFWRARLSFSALQRAENSSMDARRSATFAAVTRFSALQRAENSSIAAPKDAAPAIAEVSVLFSEPKIPQLPRYDAEQHSVELFQCSSASRKFLNSTSLTLTPPFTNCFSALQRAENSSITRMILSLY